MKDFIKTIGYAILFYLGYGIVYALLMLLFAWMANWWWVFIVIVGIGIPRGIASVIALSVVFLTKSLLKNWLGKILISLISIYFLYFSIHAIWTSDFLAAHAKEITVKIIATIVFVSIYFPGIFSSLTYKSNEEL